MKSKLLFTAALMSAMTGTAQVTWVDVRGVQWSRGFLGYAYGRRD